MGAYFSDKYIKKIIVPCDYFLYIRPDFTCAFASDFNPFTLECQATFNSNGLQKHRQRIFNCMLLLSLTLML